MSYSTEILADSPIAYWRCGEASGNFADSSGNGWTGTPNIVSGTITYGVTPTGTLDDDAITLPGGSTQVAVQASSSLSFSDPDSFTIEAIIKTSGTAGSAGIFESGGSGASFRLASDGTLALLKSHKALIASSTATVADNAWHHVAVTKSGSTVHFYVDGVEGTGTVTNATIINTARAKGFGSQWETVDTPTANQGFGGSIDEVAIYNGALSQARITAHFDAISAGASVTGSSSLTITFDASSSGHGPAAADVVDVLTGLVDDTEIIANERAADFADYVGVPNLPGGIPARNRPVVKVGRTRSIVDGFGV